MNLGTVELGEIVKDGQLAFDGPIDVSAMTIQEIPELPGLRAELKPAHNLLATPLAVLPPPFTEGRKEFAMDDWKGSLERSSGTVKLQVSHIDENGLKVVADVGFVFASPHLDADLGVVDGEVGDSELRLRGLREVTLDLQAGSVNGLSDNVNLKFDVPVSLDFPVIVGGLAFNLNIKFKFLVQTAFSAKNSTIVASGAWTTDGPIGFDRTSGQASVQTPTITVKKDLLDSLRGVSVGANGFVFAIDLKVKEGSAKELVFKEVYKGTGYSPRNDICRP